MSRYYRDWGYFPPSRPRKVKDGIKLKSRRGKIGATWWASRWIDVLESFGWGNRLQRGRRYARAGQVVSISINPGRVTAKVQGSRATPYKVTIDIPPLNHRAWEKVIRAMAAQALFAAKLLSGEMPENIEEAFDAARVKLFPGSKKDMKTDCSCPDWANPCKHIAAVYYILGERFDEDPFLIFRMRGRTKDEIIAELRQYRVAQGAAEETEEPAPESTGEPVGQLVPLPEDESLEEFVRLKTDLSAIEIRVHPPTVEAAILKRLGEPKFEPGGTSLMGRLTDVYRLISQRALELALQSDRSTE